VFLDTLSFELPFGERFFMPQRGILLAMILAALATAVIQRRARPDVALVTIVATAAQLLLIAVIDPAPYEYAYGWAMVPTLLGLPGSNKLKTIAALCLAASIVATSAITTLVSHRPPPSTSFLVLTPEAPMDAGSMPTEELVQLLLARHALWNQLAVRTELCRRLPGPVLTRFWYHPICVRDAEFRWFDFPWAKKLNLSQRNPPNLIIWGEREYEPEPPTGYELHEGFALRTTRKSGAR